MFGLQDELIVTILDCPHFYSLYADGVYARKTYSNEAAGTLIAYPANAVLALYYTYPSHRAASVIRNTPDGVHALPGLSKKVTTLFTVHASKVDKLRRALAFLNTHADGAFGFDDGFYTRLYFILCGRGKIDYFSLRSLADCYPRECI